LNEIQYMPCVCLGLPANYRSIGWQLDFSYRYLTVLNLQWQSRPHQDISCRSGDAEHVFICD
jgi:hypothetical protein